LDKIIIQVSGQADLDSTIKKLVQLGVIDEKNAKAFQKNSKATQESIDKNTKQLGAYDKALTNIGSLMAGAFAVSSVVSLGKQVIDITAKFQKFEAVLTNTLGSKSEAQKALSMIKNFAASTPFAVDELTDSFVKLANQGFKPTQQEMRKLGDLAASQGKSFNQLTEAIIDAQTGEFERLKEFGIRASKEGDKVRFTFKGVQTQADFTNDSIRNYILSLGDLQGVSGGMAAISQTLGGQISNLGDAWDSLLNTLGSGNSSVLSGTVSLLADMVKGIEDALTTTEQLDAQLKMMEKTSRETQLFGFLEEDIAKLTKAGTDALEARRLVFANELIFAEKELATNIKQLENHTRMFGDFISEPQKEILNEFKDNIEFYEGVIKRLDEGITNIDKQGKPKINSIESLREQMKLLTEIRDKQTDISDVNSIATLTKEIEAIDEQIKKLLGLDEATKQYLKSRKEWKDLADIKADPILDPKLTRQSAKEVQAERVKSMRAGMKILDAELEYQKGISDRILDAIKKREEEIKKAKQDTYQASIQFGQSLIDTYRQLEEARAQNQINAINRQEEAELKAFDKRKSNSKLSQEALEGQREAIQKKYAKREFELKLKQFRVDQKTSLAKIAIDTAVSAIKTASSTPYPYNIPLVALALAQGALQAAVVKSQPLPQMGFKKGGYTGDGSVNEEAGVVHKREYVMPAESTKKYREELEAMRKGTYEKYRLPVTRRKSLSEVRHESMADNIYRSVMTQKGLDDSRIVSELKNKDFNIKNANKVGSIIASKIGDKLSENSLFR
jgi:hypothetical protein